MEMEGAIALVAATAALVAIPGPNVALIVANTLARGTRSGVLTVLGTTAGIAGQLAIVVLGFAALLQVAANALVWAKWLGVAYLAWLGVASLLRGDADGPPAPPGRVPTFWQGFAVATVNPKTLVFNAAFLPQFVAADAGASGLGAAALLFLVVMLLGDLVWVAGASRARPVLLRLGRLRHRMTGGLFLGAGLALAATRIDR